MKTDRCVSRAISRRVREIVEWSGGGLLQAEAQKVAQRQRIGGAPRDPALRIQSFEIADQQQPKIDARRQARSADRVGIELGALRLDEIVEAALAQQLIQPGVERMTGGRRQIGRGHPHRRLPVALAFPHRHSQSLVRRIDRVDPSGRTARSVSE